MEDYAEITPADLAAHAVVRASSEISGASGDQVRWFFAIGDIHQALTAALIATLSGSMQIGALEDRDRSAWISWHDGKRKSSMPPGNRVAPFLGLVERATSESNFSDMGGTLVLTDAQFADLNLLNEFRGNILHVKPTHWSLEIAGLPRIVGVAAEALRQLFQMYPLRLHAEDDVLRGADAAIQKIIEMTNNAVGSAAEASQHPAA